MVDTTPPAKTILDYLPHWNTLLLLVLGGLLTQLWNRYRTRLRRFTWKAAHNRVAVAANDPHLGQVTVQHNGVPVNNVQLTTVEIQNDGSEDQKEVEITLAFQEGSHILYSSGLVDESILAIPFDEQYIKLYENAAPQLLAVLSTYVVHKIPVFNRGRKATFNLLVTRGDALAPFVTVNCRHLGVKLEPSPTGPEIYGVPLMQTIWVGIVLTLASLLLILRYQGQPHPYLTPIFAWLIGLFCSGVGAMAIRIWKSLARLLG